MVVMNMHLFRAALEELVTNRSSRDGDLTDQDKGDNVKRRHRGDDIEPWQMTDDEHGIVKDHDCLGKASKELFRKNPADSINARTGAFRAAARAIYAENEFIQQVRLYEELHEQATTVAQVTKVAHEQIVGRDQQIKQLESELARLRNQHVNEIAAPAAVVHAEGTR